MELAAKISISLQWIMEVLDNPMNQGKWRPKSFWANILFSVICVIKSVTSFTTNFPLDFEWAVKIKEVEKIIDNNLINHLSKWFSSRAQAGHLTTLLKTQKWHTLS